MNLSAYMRFPRAALLLFVYCLFLTLCIATSQAVAAGLVQVPRTGQSTSYYAGDDGQVQAGVAWPSPRFTDNEDGTVTDLLTGLMWVKDFNLMPTRDPGYDADGADEGAVTWTHALDYVAKLNNEAYLGYSDWRLPNIIELSSLLDASRANPALPAGHPFQNVQAVYWSSTPESLCYSQAYVAVFSDSGWQKSGAISRDPANSNLFVLAVRDSGAAGAVALPQTGQGVSVYPGDDGALRKGVAPPVPRYVDNGDGTVTDRLTGLMWTRDSEQGGAAMNWQDALDYVAGMNSGTNPNYGYTDWRLANRTELFCLLDFGRRFPLLAEGHPFDFDPAHNTRWSATTSAAETSKAWWTSFNVDPTLPVDKTSGVFVWPCRTDPTPLTGHSITGRITFGAGGLQGVEVVLSGPMGGTAYTDSNGNYTFSYLPDGAYTVTPSRHYYGFTPASRNINLSGADASGQDFAAFLTATHGWVDMSSGLRPYMADLSDISCTSDNECWISSSNTNQIFHTTDGGQSWEVQHTQYSTNAIDMRDSLNGYAGGQYGRIYRTTDGGATWTPIGATGQTVTDIECPPSGDTCYACGDNGSIYSITGTTVTKMESGVVDHLSYLSFPINSDEGWVVGGSIIRHYTEDTWVGDQFKPSGGYNAIEMLNSLEGWAVGDDGIIIHTTDGLNWSAVTNPDPEGRSLYDVFFLSQNEGWAVGFRGVVLHTTDGATWQAEPYDFGDARLRRVFFTSSTNGYAVGNCATLYKYTALAPAGSMGSIGDTVFNDLNANGSQDPGEPGVPDITVNLSGPGGPYTTSTGADGTYLFAGLVSGSYSVDVDETDPDLPPGSTLTTGNDPLTVNLGAGQNYLDADFGFQAAACTAPAITTQPQDQSISSGETADLSVTATGTAPLHYQWYQGQSGDTSTPVGTDSPTFTTPALTQTTSYWVRVSNDCGEVDSETATVTVTGGEPDDGDGVPGNVEDGAPNNGDGNRDGTPDRLQSHVASLPSATGQGYITVVLSDCDQLEDIGSYNEGDGPPPNDPDFTYPFGLVGFDIPCTSATITIYFHNAEDLGGMIYRKYGPTPPGFGDPHWYTLPGVEFGVDATGPYARFTLTDGGLGDDIPGDGRITDQGGPGIGQGPPVAIPTLNEWGMLIMMLLMAAAAIWFARRGRQAG